jgi:hypothetical protein
VKPKTNPVWKISKTKLISKVAKSNSIAEILREFNINETAANYRALKKRLKEQNIDYSHIATGLAANKNKKIPKKKK